MSEHSPSIADGEGAGGEGRTKPEAGASIAIVKGDNSVGGTMVFIQRSTNAQRLAMTAPRAGRGRGHQWHLSILLTLLVLLAACNPLDMLTGASGIAATPPPHPVIGFDSSLTGPTAAFGQAQREGFELAINEYNAAGGYHGVPLDYREYDDQADARVARVAVTRLIQQDHVLGIIGASNSANMLAFDPIAQQAHIPVIDPVATADVITQQFARAPKNYIFRISPPDGTQVAVMLAYARAHRWTQLGIIHDNTAYGVLGDQLVRRTLQMIGVPQPLADQTIQIGQMDMTAQLAAMRAAGVQQVYCYALGPEDAHIVLSATRIGYHPQFMGPPTLADPIFMNIVTNSGAQLDRLNVYTVGNFLISDNAATRAFDRKITADFGYDLFPQVAAQSYDATRMLLAALDRAGPNPERIRDAIETLSGFHAISDIPAHPFSPTNHEAYNAADLFVATYRGTELVRATR